jgi:single-strand DNA-binding protein
MANLNKVLLIGRLTRDPEIRHTPSGMPIAEMGLAMDRYRKAPDGSSTKEPVFVDLTAFGKTAELAQQYLKKGREIFVDGELKLDQWDDKTTGQKRSKLQVIVNNLQFLGAREGGPGGEGGGNEGGYGGPPAGGGGYGQRGRGAPPQGDGGQGGGDNFRAPPPGGDDDVPF